MSYKKIFIFGDREYTWEGNVGATLKSREFAHVGDVRWIGGFFFTVHIIRSSWCRYFRASEAWWVLAEHHVSLERIQEVGGIMEREPVIREAFPDRFPAEHRSPAELYGSNKEGL